MAVAAVDCEFNSFKGQLISLALYVDESVEPFYEVLPLPEDIHPWVQENVIPVLRREPLSSKQEFQLKLEQWFGQFESPLTVVADWPEDIQHLMESLIVGPGLRIASPELHCIVHRNDAESFLPHNALADAMGIRALYKDQYGV